MNTYQKYCPNVWLAKCEEKHEKGETIILTTKHGKKNECKVWNLVYERDGFFYYSITRTDGFNSQERARLKAERYEGWADSARERSTTAFEKAIGMVSAIPMGQPILVGHHSERRHRNDLERSDNAMRKSLEEDKKATSHGNKAEYWHRMEKKIDLSMPESIDYFRKRLEIAEEYHQGVKSGKYPKEHRYTLTYAKKAVNEAQSNLETALRLWGEN